MRFIFGRLGSVVRHPFWGVLLLLLVQGYFLHTWPAFHHFEESGRLYFLESLVQDGSISIDPALERYGVPGIVTAARDGRHYMDKAPGLAFVALPVYLLLNLAGVTEALHWSVLWPLLTFLCLTLPSLVLTVLLYRLTRDLSGRFDVALGLAATYAVASPALVYSTVFMSHQLAAVFLFVAFYLLRPTSLSPIGSRRAASAGMLIGLALVTEYQVALPAVGLACFGWLQAATMRRRLWLLGGTAAPLLLLFAYHTAAFGHPLFFPSAAGGSGELAHSGGEGLQGFSYPTLERAHAVLFSARRGLLYATPYLALWPLAIIKLFSAPSWRRGRFVVVWSGLAHIVFILGYSHWMGEQNAGPRYLVPVLPFLILPLAALWRPGRAEIFFESLRGGVLPGLVAVAGLHWLLAHATFPYHPAGLSHPLFDLSLPLALHGCVAPSLPATLGLISESMRTSLHIFLLLLASSGLWLYWATRRSDGRRRMQVRVFMVVLALASFLAVFGAQVLWAPLPERQEAVTIRGGVKSLMRCGPFIIKRREPLAQDTIHPPMGGDARVFPGGKR